MLFDYMLVGFFLTFNGGLLYSPKSYTNITVLIVVLFSLLNVPITDTYLLGCAVAPGRFWEVCVVSYVLFDLQPVNDKRKW